MKYLEDEVYFIQDSLSKRIKIGYSSNFKTRFRDLSNMNANKLLILSTFPGDKEDETKLHRKFAAHRTHGEWFNPDIEILDFIKEQESVDELKKHKESKTKKTNDIESSNDEEERIYSVTEAVKVTNLSRARFYQLLEQGVFPKSLYDEYSKRPYYTYSMIAEIRKVLRTNRGVNGKICMFYAPRGSK